MIKNFFRKHNTLKNSGFTLVELLVSMTLTAIFATAVVAIMPAATKIFIQIKDMSRAQIVADMIVDSLREECADTYIEDYASVRIIDAADSNQGDKEFLKIFENESGALRFDSSGSVLIIRKTGGYCEAIYSCMDINKSNCEYVRTEDNLAGTYKFENGVSSRAVYRFFTGTVPSNEALQGYVHFAYYQCGGLIKNFDSPTYGIKDLNYIYPAVRYDYTNPFTSDSYAGYTVRLTFSDLNYTIRSGETENSIYTQRPESVQVTVDVFKCPFSGQASGSPIYTRTALLVFAEDTTK